MRTPSAPRFDVATVTDCGARPYQQDALVANFPVGEEIGVGVLADGMGGHNAGDVASALVVGRAFAEIRAGLASTASGPSEVGAVLREAVEVANEAVRARAESDPEVRGMGSTLVACVTVGPDLYWVSVGDSPLYLYRDGTLEQLNEDHSKRPRIGAMVASGLIDPSLAANHPDRNQLLSAICGREVSQVDCRATPHAMRPGDVLIAASDGLQTLPDDEIRRILERAPRSDAADLAERLLGAVRAVGLPDQDNVAIMVLRVLTADALRVSRPVAPCAAAQAPIPFDAVPIDEPAAAPPPAPGHALERASDDLEKALAL